jgi:integrase
MMEGVPMPIIQRHLGHASLAITNAYLSHIALEFVIGTTDAAHESHTLH